MWIITSCWFCKIYYWKENTLLKSSLIDIISDVIEKTHTLTWTFTLGYKFVLVNDELRVETEEYLYDERSLLAEFGGALGLFLGFSFYMLWDIVEPIIVSLKKQIKKLQ